MAAAEELAIIKYSTEKGTVREIDRIGLGGAGLTALDGSQILVADAEHAWLVDLAGSQLLEIRLQSPMEIGRKVDASALVDPDGQRFPVTYATVQPTRRRGNTLIGETYAYNIEGDSFSRVSKVFFVDADTGEIDVQTAPCGGLSHSMQTSDGSIWFFTDPLLGAVHAIDEARAPAPCAVQLPANSRTLDPEPIMLLEATEGRPAGGVVPGPDDSAYLRVLDEEVAPLTDESLGLESYGQAAWETWQLDLATGGPAIPVSRPLIAGGITFFELDGAVYENQTDAGFESSTLVQTNAQTPLLPAVRMPGVPFSIQRLR